MLGGLIGGSMLGNIGAAQLPTQDNSMFSLGHLLGSGADSPFAQAGLNMPQAQAQQIQAPDLMSMALQKEPVQWSPMQMADPFALFQMAQNGGWGGWS